MHRAVRRLMRRDQNEGRRYTPASPNGRRPPLPPPSCRAESPGRGQVPIPTPAVEPPMAEDEFDDEEAADLEVDDLDDDDIEDDDDLDLEDDEELDVDVLDDEEEATGDENIEVPTSAVGLTTTDEEDDEIVDLDEELHP